MANRALIGFAKDAEDVASALTSFRDNLPYSAAGITRIITQLFAVSTVLRDIQDNPRYPPSRSRIQDDLDVILPSLQRTLDDAFDMFAQSRQRSYQAVWEELARRMDREEGVSLLERLEWYRDFLRAQVDILIGYQPTDLRSLRRHLGALLDAQVVSNLRFQRLTIDASGTCYLYGGG